MSYQVKQKEIRALINHGGADRLSAVVKMIKSGARKYHDFRKVCNSSGIYGINGLVIEDMRTGALYADAARTSDVFYFA